MSKARSSALLLDIGVGIKPQPAVRQAIEAAAQTFEQAGAIVAPVAPFFTREMLDGLDRFFPRGCWPKSSCWPADRQAKTLPFLVAWCGSRGQLSAVDAPRAFAHVMTIREQAVTAIQGYDFLISPTSPITAYAGTRRARR